jgi:D-3-phosphoglycerate dehydrogenase / 2-oxoglutarate reductase
MKPIVIVTNRINEAGLQKLQEAAQAKYLDYKTTPPDIFMAGLESCDGIVLRGAVKLTEQVLGRCTKLKVIVKHGAGVEGVDMDAATRLGIIVGNSGGANAPAVAEAAVMLMLATFRRVQAMRDVVMSGPNYHTERNRLVFPDLAGKSVGLVGFGNIARIVARICIGGFENKIYAFDPAVSAEEMARHGATHVDSLDDMLPLVDVLSLHVPLLPSTRNLIAKQQLERMRPGSIIISTARGGIINEADLYDALSRGLLYGAGLDVFDSEPPELNNPLLALKNIVVTPHCAGGSESSRVRTSLEAVEGVLDVLIGQKPPRYILNRQVLGHTRAGLTHAG